MVPFDPTKLAARQLERDRRSTRAHPGLFEHKVARMRVSSLAYLRGAAPLYYELLGDHPELRRGPEGDGWIAGDLHVENFGAYRPHTHAADDDPHGDKHKTQEEIATFNLNDFDDALEGPWHLDVRRLGTSLLLAARDGGLPGDEALGLLRRMLQAYAAAIGGHGERPAAPAPVEKLIGQVMVRTRKELLDARTEVVRGARRFVRGTRYQEISRALAAEAARAFARYAARLDDDERPEDPATLEVLDLAFRVAGTGSLGCLRLAVLVRGKGGADGAWIFDMKEEGTPSGTRVVAAPKKRPARRVLTAMQACLAYPPRMLGTSKLGGRSMLVRRLAPQEDKLAWSAMTAEDARALAPYLGALAGAAHLRGAAHRPKRPWSAEDLARLESQAVLLAAVHEGAYLAMCRLRP